jgi:5-methylcytosine-specific restriction endonuclease McrA
MAKEYATKFYASKQWEQCRESYLVSVKGLCERCAKQNIVEIAKIVHHKEYITPHNINEYDITLNHNNLEALCQDCHNKEHQSNNPNKDYLFDVNGNLIGKGNHNERTKSKED